MKVKYYFYFCFELAFSSAGITTTTAGAATSSEASGAGGAGGAFWQAASSTNANSGVNFFINIPFWMPLLDSNQHKQNQNLLSYL